MLFFLRRLLFSNPVPSQVYGHSDGLDFEVDSVFVVFSRRGCPRGPLINNGSPRRCRLGFLDVMLKDTQVLPRIWVRQ